MHNKMNEQREWIHRKSVCLCKDFPQRFHKSALEVHTSRSGQNHGEHNECAVVDEQVPLAPGVHVVVSIEECDGLCFTNGLWLVLLGDEPHLSLFP